LSLVLTEIFDRYCYFDKYVDENKLKSFVEAISKGYDRTIPYHNDLHGVDVLQTVYVIVEKGKLQEVIIIYNIN
jgi:hypothetical protein